MRVMCFAQKHKSSIRSPAHLAIGQRASHTIRVGLRFKCLHSEQHFQMYAFPIAILWTIANDKIKKNAFV